MPLLLFVMEKLALISNCWKKARHLHSTFRHKESNLTLWLEYVSSVRWKFWFGVLAILQYSEARILLTQQNLIGELEKLVGEQIQLLAFYQAWSEISDNVLTQKAKGLTLIEKVDPNHLAYVIDAYVNHREAEVHPGKCVQSDLEIAEMLKEKACHVYHPVGTCKIGNDPLAVVERHLRVHGLENLRVINAQLCRQLSVETLMLW